MKKKLIATIVYLITSLQVIGYCYMALSKGTSLSNYLFLYTHLQESTILALNYVIVGVMSLSLITAFFLWSPWPFWILGALFFLDASFRTIIGMDFGSSLSLLAEASRYIWLIAVGYALMLQRTLDMERTLPSLPRVLRAALSFTFIAHGIEAFFQHPDFVNLLMIAAQRLSPVAMSDSSVHVALQVIGSVDILCGLWTLWRPNRPLLLYMGFWGLLTASAPIIFTPYRGFFEAILRASHVGLPILILTLESHRSFHREAILPFGKLKSRRST